MKEITEFKFRFSCSQAFVLCSLLLMAAGVSAQNNGPLLQSKTMNSSEMSEIVKSDFSGFLSVTEEASSKLVPLVREKYQIRHYDDRAILTIAHVTSPSIKMERYIFKGRLPVCHLVGRGSDSVFKCLALDIADDENNRSNIYSAWDIDSPKLRTFGLSNVLMAVKSDYIKFNKSKMEFEKVVDPQDFEKSLLVKECMKPSSLFQSCEDVMNGIVWNEFKYLEERNPTLGIGGLAKSSLDVLNWVYRNGKLEELLKKRMEVSTDFKFNNEEFFVLKRNIKDDEGTTYHAILGFNAKKELIVANQILSGKYTSCESLKKTNGVITFACEGGEGGESWSFDLNIYLKQRTMKITNQKNSDDEA